MYFELYLDILKSMIVVIAVLLLVAITLAIRETMITIDRKCNSDVKMWTKVASA
jgi:hypothetical protein